MATFTELIAARDLTIDDVAEWDTPAPDLLPNGDNATVANDATAAASYVDTGEDFRIPWGTADWTFECWARWTAAAPGSQREVMWFGDGGPVDFDWAVVQSGDANRNLRFALQFATDYQVQTTARTQDVWYLINFVVKSSLGTGAVGGRTLIAYVDGVANATVTMPSTAYTPDTITGAAVHLGRSAGTTPTFIEIGKIAIYHRALTTGEMLDHYGVMTS